MLKVSSIPNCICVLRMLLVIPLVYFLIAGRFDWALVLIFLAGLSDGLDGFLAKHFGWRSRLGGILDPLADKLLLVSVFLTLAWLGLVPVWLAAVVILRDVVIISGALAYTILIGKVQPDPTVISKVNTLAQLIFVLAVLAREAAGWPPAEVVLVSGAAVLITSAVSGLDYVLRWSAKAIADGRAG